MLALLNFTSFVASSGYAAVFLLSILQSCCIPTSSELTLGFAGVLASEGKLSLVGVILAGAAGEVIGAFIAWAVGRYGGRPFVERYGRYVLMTSADLDRAEGWYQRHERFGVFFSRLLPVIRNFVAVPAGVAEVPLVRFGILTAAGSLIWDAAMAVIGYGIGHSYTKVMKGFSDAGYVLAVIAVAAIAFVIWHRWRAFRHHNEALAGADGRAPRAGATYRPEVSPQPAVSAPPRPPARSASDPTTIPPPQPPVRDPARAPQPRPEAANPLLPEGYRFEE